MFQIYKNLIIYNRNCNNSMIAFLRKYGYFDKRKPFEYSSSDDKIVLFFSESIFDHDKVINVQYVQFCSNLQNKIIDKTFVGSMKLYCDHSNIKVVHLDLNNQTLEKYMRIFKDYLIEIIRNYKIIKNISYINDLKITLIWDLNLQEKEHILKRLSLLSPSSPSSQFDKFYILTDSDII